MSPRELLMVLRHAREGDTKRGRMVRATLVTVALLVGGTSITFAGSVLYARALGPHGYGLYAYVLAWTGLLAIPVALGIPQFLVREVARAPERMVALRHWADAKVHVSGAVVAVLLAAAMFVPQAADARWMFVVAAPLPWLSGLASIRSALLQARGETVRSQWPRLLLAPALALLVLAGLWFWRGRLHPMELVVATLGSSVLAMSVNAWQVRRLHLPQRASGVGLPHLRSALPFMWVSALFLLNSRIDVLMLGTLKGAHQAGIYSVAARVAEFTSFLMVASNLVIAPKIAELHKAGDHALLQRMLATSSRGLMLATLPIGLALAIGAAPLLSFVYGAEFDEGARVLQVLVVSQLLIVASGPLGTLLNMTGHERANTNNMIMAVVANALLNLALIPAFGAIGAAVATGTSLVLSRLLLWRWVRRNLDLRPTGLSV